MGLGIYVQDRQGRRLEYIPDIGDEFREVATSGPWESVRRGVMIHGDTTFNRLQLMRLVDELESLDGDRGPVVEKVIKAAKAAVDQSNYLYIAGD
ncbi:hypothetical protein QFZ63_001057 [Streptomyces sp. B3I7]|nr:hypothetical protein [Streptomyces sp. B3I7]